MEFKLKALKNYWSKESRAERRAKKKAKKSNKVSKVVSLSENDVVLDLGNNLIKILSKNKKVSFVSKIRRCLESESVMQKNAIKYDGYNYIIGDAKAQLTSKELKIEREHIKELILYAIANLDINNRADFKSIQGITTINLYMLLPLNQLCYEKAFRELLSGVNKIEIDNTTKSYKINLMQCYAEGKMVLNNIDCKKYCEDIVVFDIGGKTTDVFQFDAELNEINKLSYGKGIQNITAMYLEPLGVNSLQKMDKLLKINKFSKEDRAKMAIVEKAFFDDIMKVFNDILFSNLVPDATTILFVGGGALALKNAIEEIFGKLGYDVKFLKDNESIFANAEGLMKYVADNKQVTIKHFEDETNCKIESELKAIACDKVEVSKVSIAMPSVVNTPIDTDLQKEKNNIIKHNKNKSLSKNEKMKMCKELLESGLKTAKEISAKSGINYSSVRRYLKEIEGATA